MKMVFLFYVDDCIDICSNCINAYYWYNLLFQLTLSGQATSDIPKDTNDEDEDDVDVSSPCKCIM